MTDKHLTRNVTFKLLSIGLLILILLYPAFRIENLISERNDNLQQAEEEVGKMWGTRQTLKGPVLLVPYYTYKRKDGETVREKKFARFLSEEMSVEGEIVPQSLYRGIYEIIVYSSDLTVKGTMKKPDFDQLGIGDDEILWEEAELQISVSDLRGIKEGVRAIWGSDTIVFKPGLAAGKTFPKGLHAPVQWEMSKEYLDYTYHINLNGSKELSFLPLAGETSVKLTSTWDSPSFTGEFVPHKRNVEDQGFSAEWGILSLNTSIPQMWTEGRFSFDDAAFGVTLFQPVNLYQKTNRSAKYAILIIFLTFLTFFIIENLGKHPVHPIQYGMIGLGLIVFYTLLLSLSEYILFHWAYLISSAMIVLIVGGYSASVFNSASRGALVGAFTALLYLFIFIIIQSEDYSLLIGSFGLYLVLAAAMYFSRKINWYKYKPQTIIKEASFTNENT